MVHVKSSGGVSLHASSATSSEEDNGRSSKAFAAPRATAQMVPPALESLTSSTKSRSVRDGDGLRGHGSLLLRPVSESRFPNVPMSMNHQVPGKSLSLISARFADPREPVCFIRHEVVSMEIVKEEKRAPCSEHSVTDEDATSEDEERSASEHGVIHEDTRSFPLSEVFGPPRISKLIVATTGGVLNGALEKESGGFEQIYDKVQPFHAFDATAKAFITGEVELPKTAVTERDLLVGTVDKLDLMEYEIERHQRGKTVLTKKIDMRQERVTLTKPAGGGYQIVREKTEQELLKYRQVERVQLHSGRATPRFVDLVLRADPEKWNRDVKKTLAVEHSRREAEQVWGADAEPYYQEAGEWQPWRDAADDESEKSWGADAQDYYQRAGGGPAWRDVSDDESEGMEAARAVRAKESQAPIADEDKQRVWNWLERVQEPRELSAATIAQSASLIEGADVGSGDVSSEDGGVVIVQERHA